MKSVLITGSDGQLGRCLRDVMEGMFEIKALNRSDLDLAEAGRISTYLSEGEYLAVINCAAYTAVDRAEEEPELAERINNTAVGQIAEACAAHIVPLIHISTDYVYDNDITRPLLESDPVHPRSVYAKTKLAGEDAARNRWKKTYILRTSWVFSEYGNNFVKTMLRLASKGIAPKVVADQHGCPTYARDLASAIRSLLTTLDDTEPGIYNFCNAGDTTWFEFARAIFETAGLAVEVTPISTSDFGAPAPRPSYSVLNTTRIQAKLGISPRSWRDALKDCIARLSDIGGIDN